MPTLSPKLTPYYGGGQVVSPANVISTTGAPSIHAIENSIGTLAIDNAAANVYGLASLSGGTAAWVLLGGNSAGTFTGLTGDNLGTATPNPAVIVAGTAGQITTTSVLHTMTLSLPAAVTAPGSLATTTTLTAGTGLTVSAGGAAITGNSSITGNLSLAATGNKISFHTGTSATDVAGTSGAMTAGTVTVTTTAVTTSSKFLLCVNTLGTVTVPKALYVKRSDIAAGTSFVITSADATDTSTIDYIIFN